MASSSSKPRTNSPFRFRKPPSVNGKLPMPAPASSSHSTAGGGAMKPLSGRSITPTRRSLSPAPVITPQKLRNLSSTSSVSMGGSPGTPTSERTDFLLRQKENISVTLRFRPLSAREIQRGDEVAWYADGDTTVRSEFNPSTAYAFDRVFGPATTTRGVYDVAAQLVVQGAMEGVNGTVFAYGVTSSGKTHTMHGDQKSPGIIPLAVKDVFSIIQETPNREFLLRVSYLEIYNEVINDLLDPAGQNLRVREDAQGTYVEGIKEEVVLSPAHALSLIAAGEEHRHVGSNNFNLLSSRSHTIFTLTVESSPRGEGYGEEDVTLSQLNLIDLAGSESSKTETTGLRRKEGSYINKSLLTLGTVIAKLSDGKASHVPYRDSKLTRLLQSSLSGHGRISLICTVTPASSSNEETHNTLKFAHRAKRVEIQLASNKILDEKSLIKKYQKEISSLKLELEQLKRGMLENPYLVSSSQEDLLTLRQQLEAGQIKMQSRLEEEEEEKAALLGRIQRLTKLILVSTKNSIAPAKIPDKPLHRRRHSFGEEELAYLPDKRRDLAYDDEEESNQGAPESEVSAEGKGETSNVEDVGREEKKTKRRGMLGWFKLRRNENIHISPASSLDHDSQTVSSGSLLSPTVQFEQTFDFKGGRRKSFSRRVDELSPVDSFPGPTQAGELFSATVRGRRPPPTGTTMVDQMDLLREQIKMLAGEVALCTSSMKRMSEQAAKNPEDLHLQVQMQKTKEEIQEKKRQLRLLEQRIVGTADNAVSTTSPLELSQTIVKLTSQLNEKAFDLEIKSADNRILQEQLQAKTLETNELQDTVASLRQQLAGALQKPLQHKRIRSFIENNEDVGGWLSTGCLSGELRCVEGGAEPDAVTPQSVHSRCSSKDLEGSTDLQSQVLLQAAEIEQLKKEKLRLLEEKGSLQLQSEKLADEAAYAKELASAAAIELKNLADEVTKLSFQNAKLSKDLANAQDLAYTRLAAKIPPSNGHFKLMSNSETQTDKELFETTSTDTERFLVDANGQQTFDEDDVWRLGTDNAVEQLKAELMILKEEKGNLQSAIEEKKGIEADLLSRIQDSKQREVDLENDLAGMWILVAQLKKEQEALEQLQSDAKDRQSNEENSPKQRSDGIKVKGGEEDGSAIEELRACLEDERRRGAELDALVSQLKSEDLDGLSITTLEDLSNLHVEALAKLCHAKAREQERSEKDRGRERESQAKSQADTGASRGADQFLVDEERNGHVCKVCFEAPTAAVLLPCRHFCLCKPCAIACTECPLCRSAIADRIITFTS